MTAPDSIWLTRFIQIEREEKTWKTVYRNTQFSDASQRSFLDPRLLDLKWPQLIKGEVNHDFTPVANAYHKNGDTLSQRCLCLTVLLSRHCTFLGIGTSHTRIIKFLAPRTTIVYLKWIVVLLTLNLQIQLEL